VTLDGSRSLGENLTYRWAFVSRPIGSAAQLYDTAGQQLPDAYTGEARPRFEVDGVGDFVISLTVTDGVDTDGPDTVTVSTTPVANAGPDQQVTVDDRVNLDGSDSLGEEFYLWTLTKPAGSATQLYTGNDQLIYVGTPAISAVATPYFYADRAGTYTVELLVQANNIYSSPDEARVTASSNLRFDPGLEAALLEATGKQPGMLDKYDLQDASLTALDAADAGIQSLDGIEKCVNLESLNLAGNQIADIADLAELQNLNRLNLAGNLVQDVTPIAGLLSLTEVDLTGNPITDFAPLVDSPAIKSAETWAATISSLCDLLERLEGAGVSVITDLDCPEE